MLSSLTAFFPCYNEEKNLKELVKQAYEILPKLSKRFEVIIVDDGSDDRTKQIVRSLQKKYSTLRLVSHDHNRGYGAVLRTGIKESSNTSEWIFWMDGDLQFDIGALENFLKCTRKFDAVLGYRAHRADTFMRRINGELYTRLINFLFGMEIRDIDCAFKLIRSKHLAQVQIETSSAFTSSEILIKLKERGATFAQLPVTHFPRQHGTPTGGSLAVIIKGLKETLVFFVRSKQMSHPTHVVKNET